MKKNTYNYYDAFSDLTKFSLDLSIKLDEILKHFDTSKLTVHSKEAHDIEHTADLAKHDILDRLSKEFLPPIEREDIISLTERIDSVTDSIEDILLFLDMFNIQKLRPEILKFTQLIITENKAMGDMIVEFKNFKSSKALHSKIVEINRLEEDADKLYVESMRNLYRTSKDPIELMCWTEIFNKLEKCSDNIEDVANVVESIVMKNS